jgi:hypothetical protein
MLATGQRDSRHYHHCYPRLAMLTDMLVCSKDFVPVDILLRYGDRTANGIAGGRAGLKDDCAATRIAVVDKNNDTTNIMHRERCADLFVAGCGTIMSETKQLLKPAMGMKKTCTHLKFRDLVQSVCTT